MTFKIYITGFLSLLLCTITFAQSDKETNRTREKYIGLQLSSLPKGCTSDGGLNLNRLYYDWAHSDGFYITQVRNGSIRMVWFNRILPRDSTQPLFEVLDVIVLPRFGKKQKIIMGTCLNGNTDTFDTDIFALVEETGSYDNTIIKMVWKANRLERKIEVIAADSLRCKDEKFFHD